MVHQKAYAKINLGLDVVGRLENGYHAVDMIMQTVALFDDLFLTAEGEDIVFTIEGSDLPADKDNLVYRAIALLREECGITKGVKAHLIKRIPIAAGMAGGSADAAAALRGMNELFDLGLSDAQLCQLGVRLGADIPYCILGGTKRARGIGEDLTPLPDAASSFDRDVVLLIAKPPVGLSTKYVYTTLDALESYEHPDIAGMAEAIARKDGAGIIARLGNVLEDVSIPACAEIAAIKQIMSEKGAMGSLMSGSGPSVFGLFKEETAAKEAAEQIEAAGLAKEIFTTKFV